MNAIHVPTDITKNHKGATPRGVFDLASSMSAGILAWDAGRRGESPATAPAAPAATMPDTVQVGARTCRVDGECRFKAGFESPLSETLGWKQGPLITTIVDGWLVLRQEENPPADKRTRCGQQARFTIEASGSERLKLRPAHIDRIGLGPDRNLLVIPFPEQRTLVATNPALILSAAPAGVRRLMNTVSTDDRGAR